MWRRYERINLSMITIGAIFCLVPFFDVIFNETSEHDDRYPQTPVGSNSSLQAFFIVIIPAADIILDLPYHLMQYFYPDEKAKRSERSCVCRLTDCERLMFIVGVAISAIAYYIPGSVDMSTRAIVKTSITNCSIQLTLGPIVLFFARCTTTFSSFRCFLVILNLVLGLIFYTMPYFFPGDPYIPDRLRIIANILVLISFGIYLTLTLVCFFKYVMEKIGNPTARKILIDWILKPHNKREKQLNDDVNDSEMYKNYIPALHMVCLLIMAVGQVYIKFLSESNGSAVEKKNFVTLAVEITILVIELRIRKNEITRGLIALLASKKSYVRYISHELRTPLNTAFLGLKLLTGEMKASKCPGDAERYDTLCDVNMSCMAAVDILNDLLCYEKLESGILELHKENVTIVPFLTGCVSMFSAQARECDVTMAVVTDVADDVIDSSYSLQPHDAIYADKFKMDQVIRNLISNALKFTPRGGALTVSATFSPDPPAETDHPGSPVPDTVYDKAVSLVRSTGGNITGSIKRLRNTCCAPKRVSDVHISKSNTSSSLDPTKDFTRGKLVVVVTDNGAGISAENQKRLFKDIVQFSPEKLQAGGGSGLGLWITGGIVDLHGGKISVFSEGEGTGCAFTVELPMIRTSVSAYVRDNGIVELGIRKVSITPEDMIGVVLNGVAVNTVALNSFTTFPPQLSQLTQLSQLSRIGVSYSYLLVPAFDVLVVDDSRLNRKMLMKCLQSDNHVCTEAQDGLEALAKVKERMDLVSRGIGQPFDAILMDFIMPNMDGPTATRAIRDLGYTASIFGVTGNGLPSDIAHFLSCGADRVLLKPLNIEAFGQAMKDVQSNA